MSSEDLSLLSLWCHYYRLLGIQNPQFSLPRLQPRSLLALYGSITNTSTVLPLRRKPLMSLIRQPIFLMILLGDSWHTYCSIQNRITRPMNNLEITFAGGVGATTGS